MKSLTKTNKNFDNCVYEQYDNYKTHILKKSKEEIYGYCYEITKTKEITDYLVQSGHRKDELEYYKASILNDICLAESNFDRHMWATWEDLNEVIDEFIEANLRYEVNAYFSTNYTGLSDSIKTPDFSSAQDFIHEHCMKGEYCEIWDAKTGRTERIDVDEYCNNFDGEGWNWKGEVE